MKAKYKSQTVELVASAIRPKGDTIYLLQDFQGGGYSIERQREKGYQLELFKEPSFFADLKMRSGISYQDYRWAYEEEIVLVGETNRDAKFLLTSE